MSEAFVVDVMGEEGLQRCLTALSEGAISCSLPLAPGKPITLVVAEDPRRYVITISQEILRGVGGADGLPGDWLYMSTEQAARAMERFQPQAE